MFKTYCKVVFWGDYWLTNRCWRIDLIIYAFDFLTSPTVLRLSKRCFWLPPMVGKTLYKEHILRSGCTMAEMTNPCKKSQKYQDFRCISACMSGAISSCCLFFLLVMPHRVSVILGESQALGPWVKHQQVVYSKQSLHCFFFRKNQPTWCFSCTQTKKHNIYIHMHVYSHRVHLQNIDPPGN